MGSKPKNLTSDQLAVVLDSTIRQLRKLFFFTDLRGFAVAQPIGASKWGVIWTSEYLGLKTVLRVINCESFRATRRQIFTCSVRKLPFRMRDPVKKITDRRLAGAPGAHTLLSAYSQTQTRRKRCTYEQLYIYVFM